MMLNIAQSKNNKDPYKFNSTSGLLYANMQASRQLNMTDSEND